MTDFLSALVFPLLAIFILVFANGFFVASEFSLVTVRRTRIEQLVIEGHQAARQVQDILHDLDTVISSTQLGITMASLALGWIGEPALAHLFEPVLSPLPWPLMGVTAASISAMVAFALITFLHIVLGELTPKSLALQRAEATAFLVARPMVLFTTVFRPAIFLLNGAGAFVLRILNVKPVSGHQLVLSEEEIKLALSDSEEQGVIEKGETEMIRRVFTFTDLTARQIMVPRRDMVCLPVTMSLDDALTFALNSAYTRFPVYDKGLDDIVGVVHVKDIMRALRGLAPADGLRSIMRPPLLVPETIGADELITHFRRHRTHMAILVDEFGGTAGLVTTQDILEEIVGDVADEFDRDEVSWEEGDDGSILLSGKLPLALINEQLGLNLSHENMVTVGGLVFSLLGRRPQVGDSVWVAGVRLSVEAMDGLRVARVRLTRVPQDNG